MKIDTTISKTTIRHISGDLSNAAALLYRDGDRLSAEAVTCVKVRINMKGFDRWAEAEKLKELHGSISNRSVKVLIWYVVSVLG